MTFHGAHVTYQGKIKLTLESNLVQVYEAHVL